MLSHTVMDKPGVTHPMTIIASNAPISLSQPARVGKFWKVWYANWRVSGTAPVGSSNVPVTIQSGTTPIYSSAIPSGSSNGTNLAITLDAPIELPPNTAVSFNIGAVNANGSSVYANFGLELCDS